MQLDKATRGINRELKFAGKGGSTEEGAIEEKEKKRKKKRERENIAGSRDK